MEFESLNVNRLTCSEHLKSSLTLYTVNLVKVLADNLVGIYLYGSLARGCYHPSTSDVDIMAVTRLSCPDDTLNAILEVHKASGLDIDAVFVTEDQLCADIYPTPVDFLVKPVSGYSIFRQAEGNKDFLLQREDTYEAGISLMGPIPESLIQPVPWDLLIQCLDFLFPHIATNFKNPVLMFCRIVYAWQHRRLCSKQQAGEWAQDEFDPHWIDLVQRSLEEYSEGRRKSGLAKKNLKEFETYCERFIYQLSVSL